MKKQLLLIGAVIVFFTAFAAQSTFAQVVKRETATIGFWFKTGKTAFPAGTYTVAKLATNLNDFRVQNAETDESAVSFGNSLTMPERSSPLVGCRFTGDGYHLSTIVLQTGNKGFEIVTPKSGKDPRSAEIRNASVSFKTK